MATTQKEFFEKDPYEIQHNIIIDIENIILLLLLFFKSHA